MKTILLLIICMLGFLAAFCISDKLALIVYILECFVVIFCEVMWYEQNRR